MSLTENSNQFFYPGVQQNLKFEIWPLHFFEIGRKEKESKEKRIGHVWIQTTVCQAFV